MIKEDKQEESILHIQYPKLQKYPEFWLFTVRHGVYVFKTSTAWTSSESGQPFM